MSDPSRPTYSTDPSRPADPTSTTDALTAAYRNGFRDGFAEARQLILKDDTQTPFPTPTPTQTPLPYTPTQIPDTWIPLRHIGDGTHRGTGCGEISHFLTRRIDRGTKADLDLLRRRDGSMIYQQEPPVCGFCFAPIDPWSASFLDYAVVFTTPPDPMPSYPPRSDPVDEVVLALSALERDVMASSVTPTPPKLCVYCTAPLHSGPCDPILSMP